MNNLTFLDNKKIIEVSKGAYWKDFPLDGLNGLIRTLIDALAK
jgi:hypothetical protein